MEFLEKVSAFISKYMAAFVIIVAAIALFEPSSFKWAAPQITYLLGIVMLGMIILGKCPPGAIPGPGALKIAA